MNTIESLEARVRELEVSLNENALIIKSWMRESQINEDRANDLKAKLKIVIINLNKVVDLVPLDERRDCTGCDYDGYINKTHHEECIHLVLSDTLAKLNEVKND